MNQKAKVAIARVLLTFVLVSVGYAVGREVTLRSVRCQAGGCPQALATQPGATAPSEAETLTVYYFHGAIRCVTCNAIERMTRQILEAEFAQPLRDGRLQWRVEDFQANEALAARYGVATSSVVLVRTRGGQEVQAENLARVWELVRQPAAFGDYIRAAVARMVPGEAP